MIRLGLMARTLLLFVPFAALAASPAGAASCCGGSSAAPLILPRDAQGMLDVSLELERYDGFWNGTGKYLPDPGGSDLRQYRLNLGYARRLGPAWQASLALPYVFNRNRYTGVSSETRGPGDATLGLWYEALRDLSTWKLRTLEDLRPSLLVGAALLIPTGVSPYDDVQGSFDVTGRGFYRLDANLLASKTLRPWSAAISLAYGIALARSVNREYGTYVEPYRQRPGDRASAAASLSRVAYIGTGGDALTATVSFSHLQEAEASIDGRREDESGMRKEAIGAALVYSSTDHDWSVRASWSHAVKASGWGRNFPATDIYGLGVSYVFR